MGYRTDCNLIRMLAWQLALLCLSQAVAPVAGRQQASPLLDWLQSVFGGHESIRGSPDSSQPSREEAESTVNQQGDKIDYLYGEWVPAGLENWLHSIAQRPQSSAMGDRFKNALFLDLGAGRGRASLMAFMSFDFPQVVGVEASDARFEIACAAVEKLKVALQTDLKLAAQCRSPHKKKLTFYHTTFAKFAEVGSSVVQTTPVLAWMSIYDREALAQGSRVWKNFKKPSIMATIGTLSDFDAAQAGVEKLSDEKAHMTWLKQTSIHLWTKQGSITSSSSVPESKLESVSQLAQAVDLEREDGLETLKQCSIEL